MLGGGVVGVEMAQAWRALGLAGDARSRPRTALLAREEPFAGEQVRRRSRERGVDVRSGVKARAVRASDGRGRRCELDDGGAVRGDELLVAVGRRPRTDDLGARDASGSSRAGRSRWTTDCACRARLALRDRRRQRPRRCSRTWASTRRASRRDVILGQDDAARSSRRRALAARDLHRPAGRGRRATRSSGARGGLQRARGRRADPGTAGASFYGRDDAPGTAGSWSTRTAA